MFQPLQFILLFKNKFGVIITTKYISGMNTPQSLEATLNDLADVIPLDRNDDKIKTLGSRVQAYAGSQFDVQLIKVIYCHHLCCNI
jgi:hypothetical protein